MDITDAPLTDEVLPEYAAKDESCVLGEDQLEFMKSVGMELPILSTDYVHNAPSVLAEWRGEREVAWDALNWSIFRLVERFHSMISAGNEEGVRAMISNGLVSANTTTWRGETPLLAAIRNHTNTGGMVRRLLQLGAAVDEYGNAYKPQLFRGEHFSHPEVRTPLQHAAALGDLTTVKILKEEFGADDSLVAPDGEIALRLAAKNGHRDVVAYLPAIRGGASKRWGKVHQRVQSDIKEVLLWVTRLIVAIPEYCCYRLPRYLIRELPTLCAELPRNCWRGLVRLGKALKTLRPKKVLHDLAVGIVLVPMFGIFAVYWVIALVCWGAWTVVKSVARLVSAGFRECAVYFNPKYITSSNAS